MILEALAAMGTNVVGRQRLFRSPRRLRPRPTQAYCLQAEWLESRRLLAATPPYTLTTIHDFTGSEGEKPEYSNISLDSAGNMYGTTQSGGDYGGGTVFRITKNAPYDLTVLHSFNVNDGNTPTAGVVLDDAGNIFGTTQYGGAYGRGTVYEIKNDALHSFQLLHSFSGGNDGSYPAIGTLTRDASGSLYGTTLTTVFRITGDATRSYGVLRTFAAAEGSDLRYSQLAVDALGNIYGAASSGGAGGKGAIFRLANDAGHTLTTLHSFTGTISDGSTPAGGVAIDAAGNIYGTTTRGGLYNAGMIFSIANDNAHTFSVVCTFGDSSHRGSPVGGIAFDAAGNLFGRTTSYTVYSISRDLTFTQLYSFGGYYSSAWSGGVTQDVTGAIYGTAFWGRYNRGSIYKLDPSAVRSVPSAPQTLHAVAGDTIAAVSWERPVSDGGLAVTDYVIQYSANNGTTWTTFSDGVSTSTAATVTGLTNGIAYVFRIAAVNSLGRGDYSSISSPVIPQAAITLPDPPTSVEVVSGSGRVTLRWVPPFSNGGAAITDYVIQYTSDNGSTWNTFNDGVSASTSATVTGLTNGVSYVLRVAAVNSVGQGGFSAQSGEATPRSPAIATIGNLSPLMSTYGTTSSASSVTVTGVLLSGPITATIPGEFEVSSDNVTYGRAVTLAAAGGDFSGTLFVRLASRTAVGVYTADVTLSSDGVTAITLPVPASRVTPKSVAITGLAAQPKTYDGTTAAIVSGTAALFGTIASDDVVLTGTAVPTFATKNAGIARTVAVHGFSLAGASAPNYTLEPLTLSADILPKQLVVRADNKYRAVRTANPLLTATIEGFVPGDTAETAVTGSASLSTTAIASSRRGVYPIQVAPGSLKTNDGNYTLSFSAGLMVVITTPAAPGRPRATPGDGRVTLTWVPPANQINAAVTDYIVQYRPVRSTRWTTWSDDVSATTSAVVTGLVNRQSYVFRVIAVNAAGIGPASIASLAARPRG